MYKENTEISKDEERISSFQRFKYDFFLCLTRVIDTNRSNSGDDKGEKGFLGDRKYYAYAKKTIYWIPISETSEPFVINFSDLTPELKEEFQEFCRLNDQREIGIFLREIAARFFENINYAYTHDSVLSRLKVVLAK